MIKSYSTGITAAQQWISDAEDVTSVLEERLEVWRRVIMTDSLDDMENWSSQVNLKEDLEKVPKTPCIERRGPWV